LETPAVKIGNILGCKKPVKSLDGEGFCSWIKSNYCFINGDGVMPYNKYIVLPYIIITDGHDVFLHVSGDARVDVGFRCAIRQMKLWDRCWRSSKKFESMVASQVVESFMREFKAKILEDEKLRDITQDDVELINTSKIISGCDGHDVFPIYFLLIKSSAPVKLPDCSEICGFITMTLGEIWRNPEVFVRMTYVSRMAVSLMAKGLMIMPATQHNDSFDVGEAIF
jgi:hypothetical protein